MTGLTMQQDALAQKDRYHADGKPLNEIQIGTDVSGIVVRMFHNRVWVDIGAQQDASMLVPKRLAKSLKIGDHMIDCVVGSVDLQSERLLINLKADTTSMPHVEDQSQLMRENAWPDKQDSEPASIQLHDTNRTLEFYQTMNDRFGLEDIRRYGWSHRYGETFMHDIYVELAQLIPQGTTRVLDLGCGGGEFAKVLSEQRPELRYLGVDLAPFFVDSARDRMAGVNGYEFTCSDFWTFLAGRACQSERDPVDASHEVGGTWDFVISCAGAFSHDHDPSLEEQLDLLDLIESSASRGFLFICHGADSGHGICMEAARERVARYSAQAQPPLGSTDGSSWSYVSPEDGRGRKPCLKKIQFKHRLVILLR